MVTTEAGGAPGPSFALELLDAALGHAVFTWRFQGRRVVTIGRGEDRDVPVSDRYVSRQHAELRFENGYWKLLSLGRNGVLFNGALVDSAPIIDQSVFRLGASGPSFRFRDAATVMQSVPTVCSEPGGFEIRIDEAKKDTDVREITGAAFFHELEEKVRRLRRGGG